MFSTTFTDEKCPYLHANSKFGSIKIFLISDGTSLNLLANLFFNNGKYVSDSINGFRGLRKDKFKKLKCDESYYAIEYQMTIRSMKIGYKTLDWSADIYESENNNSSNKKKSLLNIFFEKLISIFSILLSRNFFRITFILLIIIDS